MTSSIDTLLSLNPVEALVRMLNDANGTNYRLDRFTASTPTVVSGTTTTVVLTPYKAANSFDTSNPAQSFTVTYERLEMTSFLQGLLSGYHPSLPLSTQGVLDEITTLIGQQFYIDDIVLEEVTRDNGVQYRLKAKASSLRFVGYIDLPLITLKAISTVISSQLLDGVAPAPPLPFPINEAYPLANGTTALPFLNTIDVGEQAQTAIDIVSFMNNTLTDPEHTGDYTIWPWYVDTQTPGPFNLMGAEVIFNDYFVNWHTASEMPGWIDYQPILDDFDSLIAITIDGNWTTNFKTSTLCVPYTRDATTYPQKHGFSNRPRLEVKGVVSLSDGSEKNLALNTLQAGDTDIFQQLVSGVFLDRALDKNTWRWNADSTINGQNLAGATVAYNGQVRKFDIPAATQGLDRVIVLDFDNTPADVVDASKNSYVQGLYPIYYRSPIEWRVVELEGVVGSTFYYDFTPTNNLDDSYTYVITGTLPEGVTLVGSTLTGMIADDTEGSYPLDLTITNTTKNITVSFHTTMNVAKEIVELEIVGDLPTGVVGQDYSQFLDIVGGLGPYTNLSVIPDAVPLTEIFHNTVHVSGAWPKADTYHFTVKVGSADGQTVSKSFALKVSSSYTKLAVTGSFANGISTRPYSSSLSISGGTGIYNPPTVINGIKPNELEMSIGTTGIAKVLLEGTCPAPGIYEWTSQLTDSENNATLFVSTLVVSEMPSLKDLILQDEPIGYWPCDELSGAVLHDASGNGHDGVINVNNSNVAVGADPLRAGSIGSLATLAQTSYAAAIDLTGVMPKGSTWSIECIAWGRNGDSSFWPTLLCTDAGRYSEAGDPGIYAGNNGGAYQWRARMVFADWATLYGGVPSIDVSHLILEKDGSTANFYVNGDLVTTKDMGNNSHYISNTLYLLGAVAYPSSYGIVGGISDVAIYGHTLGLERTQKHAAAFFPPLPPIVLYTFPIVNPDADEGTTGWTNLQGSLGARDSYFYGGTSAEMRAYQEFDIPSDYLTQIQTGLCMIRVQWEPGGYSNDDECEMEVIFLDYQGSIIESVGSGLAAYSPKPSPSKVLDFRPLVPGGTISVRIQMHSLRKAGSDNNGDFDSIEAQLIIAS